MDLGQLSPAQQEALQQYTAVTDQEVEAAIPILQRSQWNVQLAISRFFDGDTTADPLAEALAAAAQNVAPSRRVVQENLQASLLRNSSRSPRLDAAPRVVQQREDQIVRKPPLLLGILFMPFHLLYKFISGTFSLFGYLFPFLPRLFASRSAQARRNTTGRRLLNPKDTATRFKREFEEQYGPNDLPLFENGYAQALDLAKKDFKFLLVVLLSPEHDDTAAYVRDTLLSPEVTAFVKNPSNNIILWIGNVQDSEAYQVSTALNCTKFPFAALISHTSETGPTAMSVILRITGLMTPSAWVANMQQTMEQYSAQLADARAAQAAQHAERSIRQEQDSAYERSLARDRERARQRREEEAARARALQEAQEAALAAERYVASLEKWRRWRAQHIAPEPSPEVKDSVRIAIRLKHERVTRRFKADTPLEELYAFVECYDMLQEEEVATQHGDIPEPEGFDHEYKFQLVSPMPRIIYSVADGGTILDKVGRSGNLIVEYIDGDEDEE